MEHKTLYDAAAITRTTAVAYDALLEILMVTEQLPAWSDNRMKRLTRSSKRFVVDSSLLVPLLGINDQAVMRDGNLLGRLVETFVLAQLRPEREVSEIRPTSFHLRDDHGCHEVDLIAEAPDGRVVACDMKATAAPERVDARHIAWFRDKLPDRFVAGIVSIRGHARSGLMTGYTPSRFLLSGDRLPDRDGCVSHPCCFLAHERSARPGPSEDAPSVE